MAVPREPNLADRPDAEPPGAGRHGSAGHRASGEVPPSTTPPVGPPDAGHDDAGTDPARWASNRLDADQRVEARHAPASVDDATDADQPMEPTGSTDGPTDADRPTTTAERRGSAAAERALAPPGARGPGELVPLRRPRPAEAPLDNPRRSDVDEWGRSEHMRALAHRVYDPIYRYWFRAEWDGLEHIPVDGGALLVANHAGAIPSDAPAVMHGIETELGRPIYGLADQLFRTIPTVGVLWARNGGVVAHQDNAYRLLREQKQLVLVFPEGTKGTGKTYSQRYRLHRFGRGGFVEIAMRAGVPVVPIAIVGAEESMPIIWKSSLLAKVTGLPYVPLTANHLMFGPVLGTVAYLPAKFKLRVLEPVRFDVPPDQDRYSKSRIMDESEHIRALIQSALYEMLRERKSIWFG
jgi:1-acyl-sn-glycerol-3-phosphate acyltransferase